MERFNVSHLAPDIMMCTNDAYSITTDENRLHVLGSMDTAFLLSSRISFSFSTRVVQHPQCQPMTRLYLNRLLSLNYLVLFLLVSNVGSSQGHNVATGEHKCKRLFEFIV